MTDQIKNEINQLLQSAGVTGEIVLSPPPKSEMGDLAFSCFVVAKELGKNPVEIAKEIAAKLSQENLPPSPAGYGVARQYISEVKAFGPYVNFWLADTAVANLILSEINQAGGRYGQHDFGKDKKIVVEFAHPNTHKAFHIGHLRNIITGESIVRLLENAGYKVSRVNYQGDVGMHIAKCLWGIAFLQTEYEIAKNAPLAERVSFLGKAYALGGTKFEADETVKAEVIGYNDKIYSRDASIKEVYETTRAWSLEYFDKIYSRVGTKFDRLYFESEVYERGVELVNEFVQKNVFKLSEGAIIFPGSEYGLHDRVFINSKGFPTYEGKEVALAELQFGEYKPDQIIHITGREQADYFKVVFKAIAQVFPATAEKEKHITYGWVRLKEGKMSSRTGNVVLGEWLLDEVEKKIAAVITANEVTDPQVMITKVGIAAVKYAMLRIGVDNDLAFDLDESVSISGDSGPYLLYIVARIKSILRKSGQVVGLESTKEIPALVRAERDLLFSLADFPIATKIAAEQNDPSQVAKYLLDVAQKFNTFYHDCPILSATPTEQNFRLMLIQHVAAIMENGLRLLGIEIVEEM